jgi:hypothetical protein
MLLRSIAETANGTAALTLPVIRAMSHACMMDGRSGAWDF